MSFVVRKGLRTALRPAPRRYAHAASQHIALAYPEMTPEVKPKESAYLAEQEHVEQHGRETSDLWRKISFYVCIPIAVCCAWVYNLETKHFAHVDHLRHDNDGVYPQPPPYEYLNRRLKPFPWGANSLFYNPAVNKNMEEAE